MKRYFDENKRLLPSYSIGGAYVCEVPDTDRHSSGNSANYVWEGETVRYKTELELTNALKAGKIDQLTQSMSSYIASHYSGTEQNALLALSIYGNDNQKVACKAIFDWIFNNIQKQDHLLRCSATVAAQTRKELNDIDANYSNNDVTKPTYTYSEILLIK